MNNNDKNPKNIYSQFGMLLILGMTTAGAVAAHANVALPGVARSGVVAPFMAALEAGQYSFEQYDKGQIEILRNQEHFRRNKEDLDFVLNSRKDLQNEYNRFMTNYVNSVENGLAKFNSIYLSGGQVTIGDFYNSAMGYINARNLLMAKIDSIEAMVSTLPSQQQEVAGTSPIPGYLNVEFEKLAEVYRNLVNAADAIVRGTSDGQVKGMNFRIAFQDGVPRTFTAAKALSFEFDNVPTMSPTRREELRVQARELRTLNDVEKAKASLYGDYLRKQIVHYRDNFGTREKYRWRTDADFKAAEVAFSRIEEAFWARSFVRVMYGVPLGVLTLKEYPKQWLKVDRLNVSNVALSSFVQGLTWEDNFLQDQRESLRQAAITIDQRAGRIFDGDGDIISKLNSIVTFAKGERPVAEVMNKVLLLMVADLAEELMITSGEGEDQILNMYKSRYYTDSETQSAYQKREDTYFPEVDNRIASFSVGTLGAEVQKLKDLVDTRADKIGQARDILAELKVEEMRGSSGAVRQQFQGRRDRLRGND